MADPDDPDDEAAWEEFMRAIAEWAGIPLQPRHTPADTRHTEDTDAPTFSGDCCNGGDDNPGKSEG